MKLKVAALAAAALVCAAAPSVAATTGSFLVPASSTFVFYSLGIDAGSSFDDVFTLTSGPSLPTGVYTFDGGISSSWLNFDSVTVNGQSFGNSFGGHIDLTDALPITIEVTGHALDGTIGSYTGSLGFTAAPVPEPETYAMVLAGLGAVGFVARRRKAG